VRRGFLVMAVAALGLLVPLTAGAADRDSVQRTFVVLYERGASADSARAAIEHAGGTVVRVNRDIGVATVRSRNADFVTDVSRSGAVAGGAHGAREEPFAPLQWDMRIINATASKSYRRQRGNHGVRVGIIDTGVDGSHPDIAANFNRALSHNFTTDIPVIDGPCAEDPDHSCNDPADVDEDGHGTHVAGTIGAPINGLGMAGVAPDVQLVNIRAGQDSGYFFVQPTVDALTYAADNGIDVVNMSYYIDPWLYNCTDNPADSPEEQVEQATIIHATERALAYARAHGVTLVSALGNEQTNLDHPTVDETSPDFPPDSERTRQVDNGCVSEPTEAPGVLGISSIGPSGRKAYYSNYGLEQTDLSAPGGDRRDFFGTDRYNTPENTIIAPYPKNVAVANGDLNADGTPNTPFVLRDCERGRCAYYQYLQGTSMASPHAVGVAALVVAARGRHDVFRGGLALSPDVVERVLRKTAQDHACPTPRTFTYPDPDLTPDYTAVCDRPRTRNGFYGDGIVDAFAASQRPR
jgi:lantibiotic leader peptide-processing serine protease